MEKMDLTAPFSALAQPTRLEILLAIARAPKGINSTQIAETTGTPPNSTSAHLTVLRNAGLVTATRNGRMINYRARKDVLGRLAAFLTTLAN